MRDSTANTPKPLVNNQLIRGALLALAERLTASEDERSLHVADAISIVLDAKLGVDV